MTVLKKTKPGRFFYKGKTFDNEKDFSEYVAAWPDMPLDLKQFEDDLRTRVWEAAMNSAMNEGFTNRDAYKLIRLATDWALEG